MTQENQELLLKDLCGRILYGVKCQVYNFSSPYILSGIIPSRLFWVYQELYFKELDYKEYNGFVDIKHCKPYLFPMSSMTDEQKEEYCQLQQKIIYNSKGFVNTDIMNYINWCYKNHIDVNGLIPLDLAIDATGLNIYKS